MLRGVAALLVCTMHCVTAKCGTNYIPSSIIEIVGSILSSIGGYGVDLFFTISGFIITWIVTNNKNANSFRDALSFFLKRCFRIFPLYWITSIVLYCLMARSYFLVFFQNSSHISNVDIKKVGYFFFFIGKYGANIFFILSIIVILFSLFFRKNIIDFIKNIFLFFNNIIARHYFLFLSLSLLLFLMVTRIGYILFSKSLLYYFRVVWLLTINLPYLLPAWTLSYEMYFYFGTFLILCLFPIRYFVHCLSIWGCIHLIFLLLAKQYQLRISYYILSCYIFYNVQILEFFLGALTIYLLKINNKIIVDKYICVFLGAVLFIIGSIIAYLRYPYARIENWEVLFFHSFSAFFIIYGLTGIESLRTIYVPKFLEKTGDISYSIYLWHFPVMTVSTILRLKFSFYALLPALVQAVFEVFMTILISLWSYKAIEMPFIRLSRKIGKSVSTVQSH